MATPFMKGVQPADAGNHVLLVPHLFPWNKDGTSAFRKGRNWDQAFEAGMKESVLR